MMYAPFVADSDDKLSQLAQLQIYLTLLSSLALRATPPSAFVGSLVTVILFLVPLIGVALETPLLEVLDAIVSKIMGALRNLAGRDAGRVADTWQPLWVLEFPMFEWDDNDERYYSVNHPFTAATTDDPATLKDNAAAAISRGYDMVINGWEVGGGSIRIHDPVMQSAAFDILGIGPEEAEQKFGFLLEALRYGCPPHGGIAFGVDRLATLMAGRDSIRDVIAFPKTTSASCLLTEAPSPVSVDQLKDLSIAVLKRAE